MGYILTLQPYNDVTVQTQLLRLLNARQGHFRLESGHHGNLWLDLDRLFVRPVEVQPFAGELARRLSPYGLAAICGPLVGGALVAQMVAAALDLEFYYTERHVHSRPDALYSVEYRLPDSLGKLLRGKAVAVVDDAISAGSALRGTLAALRACGAQPAAAGALLVLGAVAPAFCAGQKLPLERIADLPAELWPPADCPLCAAQIPLEDVTPVGA
jgi:orotate phosphoribosyltransferase